MLGKKQTWAELKAENKTLQAKLDELRRALKAADRHPIGYAVDRWIAIPLHEKQERAAVEHFTEKLVYDDYKMDADGDHRYEETHESDILPEFVRYLVRYTTDVQGNMVSPVRVWGLEPI